MSPNLIILAICAQNTPNYSTFLGSFRTHRIRVCLRAKLLESTPLGLLSVTRLGHAQESRPVMALCSNDLACANSSNNNISNWSAATPLRGLVVNDVPYNHCNEHKLAGRLGGRSSFRACFAMFTLLVLLRLLLRCTHVWTFIARVSWKCI